MGGCSEYFGGDGQVHSLNKETQQGGRVIGTLPRCSHGSPLMDWGGELLEPDCGCRVKLSSPEKKREVELQASIDREQIDKLKARVAELEAMLSQTMS